MSRKERRKELVPTRIHAKFLHQEKGKLPVNYIDEPDGRKVAVLTVEGYASTKVKDGSGDIVKPEGIDLSRFDAGNAPLKAMHGRGVLSNVGVILSAKADSMGLYIKAEARLDVTKDANGRPVNEHDYVLYDRLMNRTINGFSVGFHNIRELYDQELKANVIESMTLHEVSLVDVPDNPLTIVKMLELHQHLSSDSEMKKTILDYVKALSASDLKVGEMYRVKKSGGYDGWTWKYVHNCELLKIVDDECYFLVYELDIDGYKPTSELRKVNASDVEIVEVDEEQLKAFQEEETKELGEEEETENESEAEKEEETVQGDETDNEEDAPEEVQKDAESQEAEVAGNGDGEDAPEQGGVETAEGEKILAADLGEKDVDDAEIKQLLQTSIEQSEKLLNENEKLFGIIEKKNEKIKSLQEEIKSYKKLKVKHGLSVNKQQDDNPLNGLIKKLRS